MSETSNGEGWWLASDGKWYPPESSPGYAPPPPPGAHADQRSQQKARRPWYKKKRYYALTFLVLIIVIVIAVSAGVNHVAHVKHTVIYSVTGSGTADAITYDTLQEGSGQNGEAQVTGVALPWTKTIHASGLVTVFSVTATVGSEGGSVTCSITEDGKQIDHNTATGAFASAGCSSGGK